MGEIIFVDLWMFVFMNLFKLRKIILNGEKILMFLFWWLFLRIEEEWNLICD